MTGPLARGQMFHIGLQTRDIVTFENKQPSTKHSLSGRQITSYMRI